MVFLLGADRGRYGAVDALRGAAPAVPASQSPRNSARAAALSRRCWRLGAVAAVYFGAAGRCLPSSGDAGRDERSSAETQTAIVTTLAYGIALRRFFQKQAKHVRMSIFVNVCVVFRLTCSSVFPGENGLDDELVVSLKFLTIVYFESKLLS